MSFSLTVLPSPKENYSFTNTHGKKISASHEYDKNVQKIEHAYSGIKKFEPLIELADNYFSRGSDDFGIRASSYAAMVASTDTANFPANISKLVQMINRHVLALLDKDQNLEAGDLFKEAIKFQGLLPPIDIDRCLSDFLSKTTASIENTLDPICKGYRRAKIANDLADLQHPAAFDVFVMAKEEAQNISDDDLYDKRVVLNQIVQGLLGMVDGYISKNDFNLVNKIIELVVSVVDVVPECSSNGAYHSEGAKETFVNLINRNILFHAHSCLKENKQLSSWFYQKNEELKAKFPNYLKDEKVVVKCPKTLLSSKQPVLVDDKRDALVKDSREGSSSVETLLETKESSIREEGSDEDGDFDISSEIVDGHYIAVALPKRKY